MKQILRNVREVYSIAPGLLSGITLVSGKGILLNYDRTWQRVSTVGLSECTVSSSVENKSRTYTTTLKATLCAPFPEARERLCYMLVTVKGERYLIGSSEHPYPVSNTEDTLPGKEGESSGTALTVTYVDTLGLLKILD